MRREWRISAKHFRRGKEMCSSCYRLLVVFGVLQTGKSCAFLVPKRPSSVSCLTLRELSLSRFPFPVLSLSISSSFMRHFPFSHFPFPALPAVSSLSAFFVGSSFLLASSPQRLPSSIFALRRFLKGLM